MNKLVITSVLASISLIGFSGFNTKTAPLVGSYAPDLKIEQNRTRITTALSAFKQGYTLLHFWDSRDASSRFNAKLIDLATKESTNLNVVSVNLDENMKLYEEIVKVDMLNTSEQYHPIASVAKVRKDYKLDKGLKSFLIDANGEIIAINPSIEDLQNKGLI